MSTVSVTVRSNYGDRSTTVRAKTRLTGSGKYEIAEISRRQVREAASRCCYAGTDSPRFSCPGFDLFEETEDGGQSALRLA